MKKYLLILCLTTACTAGPPWMAWMEKGPPPGQEYPPDYVDGWRDGCHTGISMVANQWYKMSYKFKQDAYKAQEKNYYRGWKDGQDYCQRYITQYDRRQLL
jgi:hypothetical protein